MSHIRRNRLTVTVSRSERVAIIGCDQSVDFWYASYKLNRVTFYHNSCWPINAHKCVFISHVSIGLLYLYKHLRIFSGFRRQVFFLNFSIATKRPHSTLLTICLYKLYFQSKIFVNQHFYRNQSRKWEGRKCSNPFPSFQTSTIPAKSGVTVAQSTLLSSGAATYLRRESVRQCPVHGRQVPFLQYQQRQIVESSTWLLPIMSFN